MKINELEIIINNAFKIKDKINPKSEKKIVNAINQTIELLDSGEIRVANKVQSNN